MLIVVSELGNVVNLPDIKYLGYVNITKQNRVVLIPKLNQTLTVGL